MKDLDPWNLELGGTKLIEASAGTGKTHTLSTLYVRLLVEEDLLPSEILVVTYTHAATAELRADIEERIGAYVSLRWLGKQICRHASPDCSACPLQRDCPSAQSS